MLSITTCLLLWMIRSHCLNCSILNFVCVYQDQTLQKVYKIYNRQYIMYFYKYSVTPLCPWIYVRPVTYYMNVEIISGPLSCWDKQSLSTVCSHRCTKWITSLQYKVIITAKKLYLVTWYGLVFFVHVLPVT